MTYVYIVQCQKNGVKCSFSIFRTKLRKDLPNDFLTSLFHEDQRQIEAIFELACTYQFSFGCNIPRLWTSNPDEESKNKAYEAINASLDPYHDHIRRAMPVSYNYRLRDL